MFIHIWMKDKSWFLRTLNKNNLSSLLLMIYIPFIVSLAIPRIISLSSRSRIIQAFRYIRTWLADFDIKCERANTRSAVHSTFPSLSVSLLSFCSYRSIPAGLGCFMLLGSFIRAPLSFRVLIGNNSKMIPDAMLYARKYSDRNLISTVVFPCKV